MYNALWIISICHHGYILKYTEYLCVGHFAGQYCPSHHPKWWRSNFHNGGLTLCKGKPSIWVWHLWVFPCTVPAVNLLLIALEGHWNCSRKRMAKKSLGKILVKRSREVMWSKWCKCGQVDGEFLVLVNDAALILLLQMCRRQNSVDVQHCFGWLRCAFISKTCANSHDI